MNKLSIRIKLLALVAAISVGIAAVGIAYILHEKEAARSEARVAEAVRFSVVMGDLAHRLQAERGVTGVFTASQGKAFGADMQSARSGADAALDKARAAIAVKAVHAGSVAAVRKIHEALPAHRRRIDGQELDAAAVALPYTEAIAALLAAVEEFSGESRDPDMARKLGSYADLLRGKEQAGLERAAGGTGFAAGRFDPALLMRFGRLSGVQDSYFASFAANAPEDLAGKLQAIERGPGAEVARMRRLAATDPQQVGLNVWFNAATARIDAFKTLQDEVAERFAKDASAAEAAASGRSLAAMIGIPVVLLVIVGVALLIIRSVDGALTALRGAIGTVRDTGDLSRRVEISGRNEITATAEAFNALMQDIGGTMTAINAVMEKVAKNDLTERITVPARGDTERLKDNVNRTLDAVSASMQSIASAIHQVAAATSQTSAAIGQVAQGAQGQLHALGQVSTAIEQTVRAVSDVSENTHRSSRQAKHSAELVSSGEKQMEAMIGAVDALAVSSRQIDEITKTIQRIAGRTGLLSLNASIEAANADGNNKGFAVVASEVGRLAENSDKAADEIAELVARAAEEIGRAVEATREVRRGMAEIAGGVEETDRMTTSIAVAMEEQSASVTEIRASVEDLQRIGQTSAAAAEEIAATMTELATLTRDANSELRKFRFNRAA